jgi:gamma-glutamylputrescine oxidase
MTEHVESYYAATANPSSVHAALQGEITADVCVIGGGLSGCSTALHLAERGYKVALLEARRIAWGASGRNGGQFIFGYASSQEKLVSEVGFDVARRMFDLSIEALDLLEDRITRHSIACDRQHGHIHAAVRARHVDELRTWQDELSQRYGYRSLRWLGRDEMRGLFATDRYPGGLLDTRSGHLHPLNYTLGLAAAAKAAGVLLFEDSAALKVEPGDPAVVETANGRVRARYVVLCCNAYLDELVPKLRARIMPVSTYIVATEPLGAQRMQALIRENYALADINWVLDYYRRSADHRLLFGGRVSYSGLDPRNTANATRARMLKVFPQLADTKIEYAWGGYVDISMSRAPDFGRYRPNIYYLQGFSGHGVALTGLAGKLVAEAIAGHAERFDLFTKLRHRDFPGGKALRTPLLVLAMLWFRLKDLL